MKPIFLSAAVAISAVSIEASAASITPPSAFAQLEAARSHAQQLAALWAASHRDQAGQASVSPTIVSGKIIQSTVDVQQPPAAPKLNFQFKTGPAGFAYANFVFYNQATGQSFSVDYSASTERVSGSYTIQNPGSVSQYAAPGTYTMQFGEIADTAGNLTSYSNTQLASIFASLNVTVKNGGTPDTTAPVVTSGRIKTPTVSLSSPKPLFLADLTVSDTISGVSQGFIGLSAPNGGYYYSAFSMAPSPITHAAVLPVGFDFASNGGSSLPTGTWTISEVIVYDVAGNVSEPDVQTIFGSDTFQVTQ